MQVSGFELVALQPTYNDTLRVVDKKETAPGITSENLAAMLAFTLQFVCVLPHIEHVT